ncbi:RCC1 domain-containing protein [Pseudomonas eucalypticola]|uniref:Uncharacterized protein n=1 Tax=Pseudomonas eucalypticola TaxID=2599595 RepID=A0A7D5D784_9PSED|nr:hypothetical protein [Pseudomonas eucalypticola]QKZ04578.1 hypothetical protein HWQ56_12610 [Pseudomonas eucalypticola]
MDSEDTRVLTVVNLTALMVSITDTDALNVNDFIQVYWGDEKLPVATYTVTAPTAVIDLLVSPTRVPAGEADVYYTVRSRNRKPRVSSSTRVLVNVDGPAGARRQAGINALPALSINGGIELEAPLDYGVNAALLAANLSGLLVTIYRNTTLELNDFIQVYWGNDTVAVATHTVQSITDDVFLYIPAGRIPLGEAEAWYTVRPRNNVVQPSPRIRVLVKVEAPGGINPDPTTPGHKSLKPAVLPQAIIDNGVGPDSAPFVVRIEPYPERALKDTVQLSWGGVYVTGTITDLAQAVEVTITQDVIDQAGDSDSLVLAYRCWDLVHNISEWSLTTTARVWAADATLDAPVIVDAVDGIIDLALLGQNSALIQVYLSPANFATGDTLRLFWEGRTAEGQAVNFTVDKRVTRVPFTETLEVPNDTVRAIVQGRANVYFSRIRTGTAELKSKREGVAVTGEVPLLLPPNVLQDPDQTGVLDPTLPRVNISIQPYAGMAPGDQVTFFWLGTLGNGSPHYYTDERFLSDASVGRPVTFVVGAEHIALLDGGTAEAYYEVLHDGATLVLKSQRRILQIGDATAELAAPYIDDVEQVLNPDDYPFGVEVKIAPYNNMYKDDDIYFDWVGDAPGGSFSDHIQLPASGTGRLVSFYVDAPYLLANRDKDVELFYRIDQAGLPSRGSDRLTLHIGAAASVLLPRASIEGVDSDSGVLNPGDVTPNAHVIVDYRPDQHSGDQVTLEWVGEGEGGSYTESKSLSGNAALQPINFYVPSRYTYPNVGRNITIGYRVEHALGGESRSQPLVLRVEAIDLAKPTIAQAGGTDKLNPDDVQGGATVEIPIATALKNGDTLTVILEGAPGAGSTRITEGVPADQGNAVYPVTVPHAVVLANDGRSITLRYEVVRRATGQQERSAVSSYDVARQPGQGVLKIMGARYSESAYRASGAPRRLSAFNATTMAAISAQWKYPSETTWTTGTTFRDRKPDEVLQVRAAGDTVNLSPANIIGNGNDTTVSGQAAFTALRDTSDMRGWGAAAFGGNPDPTLLTFTDIVEISATRSAFVVRRANNFVVPWGNAAEGGTMGAVSNSDFLQIRPASMAFAGIKRSGEVVAWGNAANGGTVGPNIPPLRDIISLHGNGGAFAARRATGQVVAWGAAASGGTVTPPIDGLSDITDVIANYAAFAALRSNGHVVAWGTPAQGGAVPADIAGRSDIVELSSGTAQAFAVRTRQGGVLAWGPSNYGGVVPPTISQMSDIVEVSSTWQAFAAVRGNGHVVAWGMATMGGTVPDDIAALNDIVQVTGTARAFAALRRNGTVVAWGDVLLGGNTAPVVGDLVNIVAVYSNSHAFVALSSDGRVVTWGYAPGGGDSSLVGPDLQNKVSHIAHGAALSVAATALVHSRD